MFREEIVGALEKEFDLEREELNANLEIPPSPELGDYAFPCHSVSKELKKNPKEIAEEYADRIKPAKPIDKVKAAGPYINFFIKPEARAEKVIEAIKKGRLWRKNNKEKVLIEYPSPNTNKPLHLGHVRNMALGKAVSNLLQKAGKEVVQVNLNNDRGIHICKSMLAYKKWGDDKKPDKKPDHFVGDYYVKFSKEAEKKPELEEEAREMLKAWEEGDEEVRKLWLKMNTWALDGFAETYDRYGVGFDKVYNESDIYLEGKQIVLDNKGKFEEDETGALVARLEKQGIPDKVVLRSDGTSIYVTQDIGLTKKKIDDYEPDRQIWVVANEQNTYFRQLFAILENLGIAEKKELYHLSYGMIALPSGRMKSREGTVVDADDLLDEMEELAAEEIRKRNDWKEGKVKEVAEKVALAAIKFYILAYDPKRDFTFDPESSLDFEGDTGPYLQYTHARISSIMRKAGKKPKGDTSLLTHDKEQSLLRELERAPEDFAKAAGQMKPSAVCSRLLDIAHAFNTFYHNCPVLDAEEDVTNARIELITATKEVLAEGMETLGFEAPGEM